MPKQLVQRHIWDPSLPFSQNPEGDPWADAVSQAQQEGARAHLPNGLPIKAIKGNLLLEHPGGDHPQYLFPIAAVRATQIGPISWSSEMLELAFIGMEGPAILTVVQGHQVVWDSTTGKMSRGLDPKEGWFLSRGSLAQVAQWRDNGRHRPVDPKSGSPG